MNDERQRLRRVYIIPNLFTALNLFLGVLAIYAVHQGEMRRGCWLIVLAAVLDGLDGAVARLTHTQSRFGLEFDSLSDLASFGVAPSLAAFVFLSPSDHGYTRVLTAVCALFAVCGALRLARYNVQASGSERKGFLGMPIPGAAMGIVSTVLLFDRYSLEKVRLTWLPIIGNDLTLQNILQAFFPFLILALALLMV
ncbi:MAG: CDP-diacylglycerol--serine O-phosphatidyltransferase, partial [Candidatus Sumerlaeota bacterium]